MRVLCNDKKCFWWKSCNPQKLMYGRYQEGMTEFTGECGRKQDNGEEVIGILPKEIITLDVKLHVPECVAFSNTGISGHLNFSKMLNSDGTPLGGNIPDPISGDSAFHT